MTYNVRNLIHSINNNNNMSTSSSSIDTSAPLSCTIFQINDNMTASIVFKEREDNNNNDNNKYNCITADVFVSDVASISLHHTGSISDKPILDSYDAEKIAKSMKGLSQSTTINNTKFNMSSMTNLSSLIIQSYYNNSSSSSSSATATAISSRGERDLSKSLIKSSKSSNKSIIERNVDYYQMIIKELGEIGWENIVSLDESLSNIEILVKENQRQHILRVKLPSDYPHSKLHPKLEADTPVPFVFGSYSTIVNSKDKSSSSSLSSSPSLLRMIVDDFQKHLEQYQHVFDILDDIDKHTWVIEPSKLPCYSLLSRRIIIGKHQSIHIRLSINNPYSPCECTFLGADIQISPLRSKFNENIDMWNGSGFVTVRENLEIILGITFPLPKSVSNDINGTSIEDEFDINCAICYQYEIDLQESDNTIVNDSIMYNNSNNNNNNNSNSNSNNNNNNNENRNSRNTKRKKELPDIVCENVKCARSFHSSCLLEWLRSLPSTRQSFNTLFGSCPFCNEGISITR